ncbi:MAG: response regulator, partial [Spirochaeta sp.]|nr:response regulator [Spirochaeta sp.]
MNNGITKTILLVEDEVLIAMAEKAQLQKYGYDVHHVSTGEKAVETIADTTHPVDLILMDIDLGSGIDGTEAARQILKEVEIPIVFLSSHTEPEVVEKTEKITSYGYVVKNSSTTVIDASIKMAFRLFDVNIKLRGELIERKRIDEALQESEVKFRALFEKGPIGVAYHEMVYDDSGKAIDYRFLAANESYLKLTGVDPRGKLVTEAFPGIEDEPFDWIGTLGHVARTGEEIRLEQHLQTTDRWYDCVGYQVKPDHFVAAFVEITERKRAEEKLHLKSSFIDGIAKVTPDLFITYDKAGVYLEIATANENDLFLKKEELLGSKLSEVL